LKDLNEILSSSDLKKFSDELKIISDQFNWKKLDEYINQIDTGINSFDFESIQNLLKKFNQIVDEIR